MNLTVIEAFDGFVKHLDFSDIVLDDKYDICTLNAIKIIRHWSKLKFETLEEWNFIEEIIIEYYKNPGVKEACKYVDIEFCKLLEHIYFTINEILNYKKDFKGLSYINLLLIKEKANEDLKKATKALELEKDKNYRGSIEIWMEILGKDFFPRHGFSEEVSLEKQANQPIYDIKTTDFAKRIF